jgi:outer membrane protein assembly factor BamB
MRLIGLALALLASVALGGEVKPGGGFGYRGDGTCVERTGNPPIEWDGATGKNILWAAPLPNWNLGCPIPVGDRVLVMSEPDRDSDWPSLVCLDAKDGKVIWKKELDHFAMAGLPEAQVAEARKAWHDSLEALRNLYRMRHVYATATDKEAAKKTLEQKGCEVNDAGAVTWKSDGTKRGGRVDVNLARVFNRAGLYFDVWHLGGMGRIGYAYPTPVTDGERVYVGTGMHGFACFDLEGHAVWQRRVLGQGSSNAGYGGDDFCKNARSPLLYGNLFISDVGNLVRAFEKQTGKLLWSDRTKAHEIVTPVILTAGGKDILLCGDSGTVAAYLLPDGKKLAVEGWKDHGGTMLVKHDERDVVFFTGGGEHGGWEGKGNCDHPPPAAVRFALEGDPSAGSGQAKLKAKVLWSGIDGKSSGECHTGLLYEQGRLYHKNGFIMEAATGRMLKVGDRHRVRYTPSTRHLIWLAGGRLYGVNEGRLGGQRDGPMGGLCQVYDLDGKKLAENFLPIPKPAGERLERAIEIGCANFSYGCPFTIAGDRIYVRASTVLYCIGKK